jgi:RNA polymerase sigma-70 factor (ECF subfamily)
MTASVNIMTGWRTGRLATGCWLLAAGCWLLATGYWLLAAGCWLLAGRNFPERQPFIYSATVMPDADERQLVEAAQRDPSKFAALYERHFNRIYAYVVLRVHDRDAAEDVTSDVFQKALAAIPKYESRGAPFGAWLIRIASNVIADRWKRWAREAVGSDLVPEHSAEPDVERVDRLARVFTLVESLPAEQRTVIVERYVEGRSIRDVAGRLGKTEGAVKQLQFRALQALRRSMEGADA